MSIERVKDYFKKFGMEERVLEFDVSSATVELAAQALGCEPCRIAKSLTFSVPAAVSGDNQPASCAVMIVCAGDVKIDNHKYKEKFHTKAKMLTYDETAELTGHAVGGVCPFAVNDGVAVYLDESLKRFETVFPACGSSNSAIELTIPELERCSGFTEWVDVCK